jgi:hypothetical protein
MHQGHWRLTSTLVFCSIVAGLGTTRSRNADATEGCLAAPKDSTPQGKHWYYRIEHPSKRHCWYLGDEGRKISQASASSAPSPSESLPPAKPAPRQSRESLQPAVANARAELTMDIAVPFTTMPPIGQQTSVSTPNNWQMAERWPDPQMAGQVTQANTAPPPPAPAQPTAVQQSATQKTAAPASVASPTPTVPTEQDDTYEVPRVVLGILTAAIALAAIIGRLILTHRRPRTRAVPRRPIWQMVDDNNVAPVYARAHVRNSSLRARAEQDVEELLRALRYPEQRVTSPVASANRGQRPTGRSGARA